MLSLHLNHLAVRLHLDLEVCVPELFFSKRDETGGHFPNSRDCDKTTYVWYCCSGKFMKNLGRDYSVLLGKSLEWS